MANDDQLALFVEWINLNQYHALHIVARCAVDSGLSWGMRCMALIPISQDPGRAFQFPQQLP